MASLSHPAEQERSIEYLHLTWVVARWALVQEDSVIAVKNQGDRKGPKQFHLLSSADFVKSSLLL